MSTNENITKLASLQAALIEKTAECRVLRNRIAELKKSSNPAKNAQPAVKKPTTKTTRKGKTK